jgi:hypothetical protein
MMIPGGYNSTYGEPTSSSNGKKFESRGINLIPITYGAPTFST